MSANREIKRILCVTSNFPRWEGDSTTPFVLHLAQDLQKLGWEVDVLAPHAASTKSEEEIGGVKVFRFRYLWPERLETVCYQGGALINLAENPLNYFKLPALVFFEWVAIVRRLMTGNYDLLHSHWILPQGFTGVLATKLLNVPHVITVHGGDAFALQGKVLSYFKKFSLLGADAVSVNSSVTNKQVHDIAANLEDLHLIPMGVSLDKPDQQSVARLRSTYRNRSGPLLIFVGRLVFEKGVDDLLNSVALIKESLPDVRVLVVGEGQLRGELEQLAKNLGIESRVTFVGWVEPSEVSDYLSAADIFVGPSKRSVDGWIEGQGLTFLEAMAVGTPVIATASGGIQDVVEHEETGLLVPEESPPAIANAVLRLVKDKNLAETLVEGGANVAMKFTRIGAASRFSRLFKGMS